MTPKSALPRPSIHSPDLVKKIPPNPPLTKGGAKRCSTCLLATLPFLTPLGLWAQVPPELQTPVPEPSGAPAKRTAEPSIPPPLLIKPGHPDSYTVMPGDTHWHIAGKFLDKPWQWAELRGIPPQLTPAPPPKPIYPGDTLRLRQEGVAPPQLEVLHPEGSPPLIRLSPEVRSEAVSEPVPPVPRDAIESYLIRGMVLSQRDWHSAAYIVGDDDEQITFTERDRIYARGGDFDRPRYHIFRPGEALILPGAERSLGTMGVYMGEAVLERDGDPAALVITRTTGPIRAGDRLFEIETERELFNFEPKPVPIDTEGVIIAPLNSGVIQITQNSSVIINLGLQDGMKPGHVLAIYRKDRKIEDPIAGTQLALPGERTGLLMVYKVHDEVSFALVMDAERSIRLYDRVTTP